MIRIRIYSDEELLIDVTERELVWLSRAGQNDLVDRALELTYEARRPLRAVSPR